MGSAGSQKEKKGCERFGYRFKRFGSRGNFVAPVACNVTAAVRIMKNATALEKDGDARHCREFQEFSRKPSDLLTRVEIADSTLQAGQGMHGSFSRADTLNNMAAIGPDFKAQYKDHEPVSNPDVAVTIAHLLGMQLSVGNLIGRNLREARSTVIPHLSISPRSKRQARYSSPTHGFRRC